MSLSVSTAPNAKHRLISYTLGEELFNAITHGVGAALAIVGTIVLLASSQGPWAVVSSAIYGASMILLFTMSCLYHSLTNPKAKYVMRVFDHTTIYLLIAGTYTPFTLVTLRADKEWVAWTIFGVVWASAVVGIILNAISIERFKKISMVCYVASGWCIVAAIRPLIRTMEPKGLFLLFLGGLMYTGGIVFYALRKRYMHSIWHLFVLAGAVLHYFCILFYVV